MSIWRYTRIVDITDINEQIITNNYLRKLMYEDEEYKADFTDEAIYYIRELLRPFITRLNTIQSGNEVYEYTRTRLNTIQSGNEVYEYAKIIPYRNIFNPQITSVKNAKEQVLNSILELLTYDDEDQEPGVQRNIDIINPWHVFDYISSHQQLLAFFNPPQVIVDVTLNGVKSKLSITPELLLGIMAVYRYLHTDHPFTMYGFPLSDEAETVNNRALKPYIIDYTDWFNVFVSDDIYAFDGMDFF